jgi:hypothetical protein
MARTIIQIAASSKIHCHSRVGWHSHMFCRAARLVLVFRKVLPHEGSRFTAWCTGAIASNLYLRERSFP